MGMLGWDARNDARQLRRLLDEPIQFEQEKMAIFVFEANYPYII